ncbi:hypothetical protein A3Q56_03452 [Intoshia linei]|uniref:Histone deacetylase domain-containing protein n=1 Tax=Intoshia linei TaxID=1819745 RepID=A0A177B5V6_9BILA|nr:hypothetical protein A3Q56_03452 [Intoshia linei]
MGKRKNPNFSRTNQDEFQPETTFNRTDNMIKFRTAISYSNEMNQHESRKSSHPENPNRLISIYRHLCNEGLLEKCYLLTDVRSATLTEIQLIHSFYGALGSDWENFWYIVIVIINFPASVKREGFLLKRDNYFFFNFTIKSIKLDHIKNIEKSADSNEKNLDKMEKYYESIYLNQFTYSCAKVAIGHLLNLVDAVMTDKVRNGMAFIRPPGHHSCSNSASGFCIFNNVAIASQYAIHAHNLSRILIVDWDIHHGDGTQEIFYENPKVLYISIHRYDNAKFFPYKTSSNYDYVGKCRGKGFNINMPFNGTPMGDTEYMMTFLKIIMPVSYQFNPQLVLVSSGFDAAIGDPLGNYNVSPECYGHMTYSLSSLACGRVILVLEGGYNLQTIATCSENCVKSLLGHLPPPLNLQFPIKFSAQKTIFKVMESQELYWNCLKQFKPKNKEKEDIINMFQDLKIVKNDI